MPTVPYFVASTHFQEVAFVFNNIRGLGYAINPFGGEPASYPALSQLMSRAWVSFVHDLDPNNHGGMFTNIAYNLSNRVPLANCCYSFWNPAMADI